MSEPRQDDDRSLLLTRAKIETKVAQLAAAIDRDYAGRSPVVVGILKGAFMFLADLVR